MSTEQKKLKISCTDTDCNNGLHCFRVKEDANNNFSPNRCRECGAAPIDWMRVHKRSETDIDFTIKMLHHEFIRDHFWKRRFNERSLKYALRKGRTKLEERTPAHLQATIGNAQPFHDGYQTPTEDHKIKNPFQYAQHATATCCRTCLGYWHGIPKGRELTQTEISYLANIVNRYLAEKLPGLPANKLTEKEIAEFDLSILQSND